MWKKTMKFNFAIYAARDAGLEGNIWFSFKIEMFYSRSEVAVSHLKVTVPTPLIFRHSRVAP